MRCMVYMDLNMVRAGVVMYPSEWPHGGYNEIQKPPQRYTILDHEELKGLLGLRLGQLYRVASFIGLAAVLILVSFLYQRFMTGKDEEEVQEG